MEYTAKRELLVIRKKTDEVGGARSWKRRKEGEERRGSDGEELG